MTAAIPGYSAVPSSAVSQAGDAALLEPRVAAAEKRVARGQAAPWAPSESWLLAWAAGRSGFPCVLAIGKQAAAMTHGTAGAAVYAVHLAEPVPVAVLMKALGSLRRRGQAVLLIAEKERSRGYREHLRLDEQQQVVSIHRSFRKGDPAKGRACVLGVAWKVSGMFETLKAPVAGACWRSVRVVLRRGGKAVGRQIFGRPARIEDAKSDLVGQLTPGSLLALAEDAGYRRVRDFCFASPEATVAEDAFLRGPLFIAGDAVVTAEHVHVGPGWVTAASPAVTLPSRPELMDLATGHGTADGAGHVHAPYFVGPGMRARPRYEKFKRMLDVPFAIAALLATLPICVVAAIVIKLYDRGPIFFVHPRESVQGRPFGCLKFRTMVRDAEALKKKLRQSNEVDGPQFKMTYDPRITPIGHFLRRTNIDELPQFINVLLGHMSVVGPRPSPFEENQLCPAWREARLSVKPGITGLWQVSRSRERGAADFQEWIFYDTQYVERRSFFLDVKIILLTIKELFGKGQ